MDIVDKARRSAMMAGIKSKDTKPELLVRQAAHALGYRFRLHRRDLPGSPDLVFPGRRKVIFVHGCYWHRHPGCRLSSTFDLEMSAWRSSPRHFQRDQAAARCRLITRSAIVVVAVDY